MTFIPRPHEIYKHFKGNLYQIVAIAEHTETGESLVIYQALYGDFKTYARPLPMFTSEVDRTKYPDVPQRFRFELQGPESHRQIAAYEAASQSEISRAAAPQSETTQGAKSLRQSESGMETSAELYMEASAELSVELSAGPGVESKVELGEELSVGSGEKFSQSEPGRTEPVHTEASQPEEELTLDPLVLEFLDADTYEQRLNILACLHHRITDEMITTMAIACDIEVNDGRLEERYDALKSCLLTLEKYECNRLR